MTAGLPYLLSTGVVSLLNSFYLHSRSGYVLLAAGFRYSPRYASWINLIDSWIIRSVLDPSD